MSWRDRIYRNYTFYICVCVSHPVIIAGCAHRLRIPCYYDRMVFLWDPMVSQFVWLCEWHETSKKSHYDYRKSDKSRQISSVSDINIIYWCDLLLRLLSTNGVRYCWMGDSILTYCLPMQPEPDADIISANMRRWLERWFTVGPTS